jgi:NAD(P)-dependent dehydrogenase (short-subunit alcohol dehydrogenase family)
MARMALFLASDEASFATGSTFNNDGGWSAMSGISVQALARQ